MIFIVAIFTNITRELVNVKCSFNRLLFVYPIRVIGILHGFNTIFTEAIKPEAATPAAAGPPKKPGEAPKKPGEPQKKPGEGPKKPKPLLCKLSVGPPTPVLCEWQQRIKRLWELCPEMASLILLH